MRATIVPIDASDSYLIEQNFHGRKVTTSFIKFKRKHTTKINMRCDSKPKC